MHRLGTIPRSLGPNSVCGNRSINREPSAWVNGWVGVSSFPRYEILGPGFKIPWRLALEDKKDELLQLWFGEGDDDAAVAEAKAELWWGHRQETDELLQASFGAVASAAAADVLDHWAGSPRGRLALILALDQLPRAIHRDAPEAFAQDAKARKVAEQGLESGADRLLRPIERLFVYLPFEHSEDINDQDRSVELFRDLVATVPQEHRETFAGFLDYAVRHREVIRRFGRFPHRNQILGREPTPEEKVFLDQPGSSF
jgi:uncharacterized protein (DUF924 family)